MSTVMDVGNSHPSGQQGDKTAEPEGDGDHDKKNGDETDRFAPGEAEQRQSENCEELESTDVARGLRRDAA